MCSRVPCAALCGAELHGPGVPEQCLHHSRRPASCAAPCSRSLLQAVQAVQQERPQRRVPPCTVGGSQQRRMPLLLHARGRSASAAGPTPSAGAAAGRSGCMHARAAGQRAWRSAGATCGRLQQSASRCIASGKLPCSAGSSAACCRLSSTRPATAPGCMAARTGGSPARPASHTPGSEEAGRVLHRSPSPPEVRLPCAVRASSCWRSRSMPGTCTPFSSAVSNGTQMQQLAGAMGKAAAHRTQTGACAHQVNQVGRGWLQPRAHTDARFHCHRAAGQAEGCLHNVGHGPQGPCALVQAAAQQGLGAEESGHQQLSHSFTDAAGAAAAAKQHEEWREPPASTVSGLSRQQHDLHPRRGQGQQSCTHLSASASSSLYIPHQGWQASTASSLRQAACRTPSGRARWAASRPGLLL